jgi:UDP-glucose 4-epimerase
VGAHESGTLGELPRGVPGNLIPFIVQTAAGIRKELNIFGDDYDTPDGTAVRDFIHVVDLAKAHVIALQRMLNDKQKNNYEYFNIGTGNGLSVLQIIQAFEKVNKVKVNYRLAPRRAGDIEKIYADTSFANDELGWRAERDIDEMMRSAWEWQQYLMNHPGLNKA